MVEASRREVSEIQCVTRWMNSCNQLHKLSIVLFVIFYFADIALVLGRRNNNDYNITLFVSLIYITVCFNDLF